MNNKILTYPRYFLFTLILVTLFSSQPLSASAQEVEFPAACGNFIDGDYISPIEDCVNPFRRTDDLNNYMLGTETAVNNQTYLIDSSGLTNYGFSGENYFNHSRTPVYRHEGTDYVAVDTDFTRPERIAIEEKIAEYFNNLLPGGDSNQITLLVSEYLEIYESQYKYPYFYLNSESRYFDVELNRYIEDVYYELEEYIEQNVISNRTALLPGTYTVVFTDTDEGPVMTQNDNQSLLERLWASLVPKAYAYYYVRTVTFTLIDTPPEPEGASSVLFLPGMQASRLYKDGLVFTEDQLWVPNVNQDMAQLKMRADGSSENDVYTRDIIDEVFGFGTVYKDFTTNLDSLISDNKISDWKSFAYDWRFSVEDIARTGTKYENEIKNATDLFLSLAEESRSGKVTIVGHSNGGLLAKAIIDELVNSGEEEKVDTLILLASPQLGTPKAIGALLHGFDQDLAGGLLVSANLARDVAENMPGAYGLLPTEEYMDSYDMAPVRFVSGDATSIFSEYGEDVDSQIELDQFLTSQLDSRTSAESVYDASILNENLLNDTRLFQSKIGKSWRAPQNAEVIEVVGVGLPTVSGFEYRNYYERVCSQQLFSESCVTNTIYKPVPIFSLWGDQTVVTNSAEGYGGDKETYYFDLRLYR